MHSHERLLVIIAAIKMAGLVYNTLKHHKHTKRWASRHWHIQLNTV